MGKVRNPIKKSSIQKKNKIIEKGFELICSKGYHNITCVDIAAYASVSTGIIYQYFENKRDIFIEGIKNYSNKIMLPMNDIIEDRVITKDNLRDILNNIIDEFIKTHTIRREAHEEIMAMSYLDQEVSSIFNHQEIEITEKIALIFKKNNFETENIEEKIHIIYGLIDNYCHELVYHKHDLLNYDNMRTIILDMIENILIKK